jgi:serine/threonine protein phosphatase PrpC
VSGGGGGLMAAQTTVMSIVEDFFSAPAHWESTVTLDRLIRAQNAWLAEHNRRLRWARDAGTALCTLTALVLRGHGWTLAHVGDSRAWLLRDGDLHPLSQDHVLDAASVLDSRITRAVGLDEHILVDFEQGELHTGDTLLLTSDGVHGLLKPKQLLEMLEAAPSAQHASEALVQAALQGGGQDNASALVLRVRGLDAAPYDEVRRIARTLPVPPRLREGATLDHFRIVAPLADNGVHRVYSAIDIRDGANVVIKALHEARASDPEEREMLAHEGWLGARLSERLAPGESAGFVRVREIAAPSAFYLAFDWQGGRTLEERLEDHERGSIHEIVQAMIVVTRALAKLHRAGVIHRDIKPGNLHQGEDGLWRILDLGAALSGHEPESQRTLRAGTPSFINPEQWDDPPAPADAKSDLYALGVTLYQWLTGRLPYGEIEPYQRARFRRDPTPPSRIAPDVPMWLDHLARKAVALEPAERFETAEELLLALERGASRALPAPRQTPLAHRDPRVLWQIGLGVSLLVNLLLVVWLLFLPR